MSKRESQAKAAAEADEFVLPQFDEETFVEKEIAMTRATTLLMGLGALLGAISYLLPRAAPWTLGVLLLFVGWASMRPLLSRMGIPPAATDWKALLGYAFWMFTAWLVTWAALLNFA